MEDIVKKLFCLILTVLSIVNIPSYLSANVHNQIIYAIKKSLPDKLKQNLFNADLSTSKKNDYIAFAKGITKIREKKIKLDKTKPKTSKTETCVWAMIMTGGYGAASAALALGFLYCKEVNEAAKFGGLSLGAFALSYICYRKLDDTFGETFRTRKQKYLDSMKIQAILKGTL